MLCLVKYGRHTNKKNKGYLTRMKVARMQQIGIQLTQEELLPALYQPAVSRLQAHLLAGDRVVLLTGTPEFIARPLAQALNIAEVSATLCVSHSGRYRLRTPRQHPFGASKAELAQAICHQLGLSLHEAVAYADSYYDLPLLERVAEPVAVRPDQRLRRIATQRGWEIIDQQPGMAVPLSPPPRL
jgi:phosphoserine phosphatase